MSRQHKDGRKVLIQNKKTGTSYTTSMEGYEVVKQVDRGMKKEWNDFADEQNTVMWTTAAIFLLLSSYMMEKMETFVSSVKVYTRFAMRCRNLGNHIVQACKAFTKAFEDELPNTNQRLKYVDMQQGFNDALDSWFKELSEYDADNPKQYKLDLRRRSKLKYRETPKVAVRECNEYFEDGYCKGWTDAVNELLRRLQSKRGEDVMLNFGTDGEVIISEKDNPLGKVVK